MVVTNSFYNNIHLYEVSPQEYTGVVYVTYGGFSGSGVLLYDGKSILTTAHIFENETYDPSSVNPEGALVYFRTEDGFIPEDVSFITINPLYKPIYIEDETSYDLAIVHLKDPAPIWSERYELYRNEDEVGKVFEALGFGLTGSGLYGFEEDNNSQPELLKVQ